MVDIASYAIKLAARTVNQVLYGFLAVLLAVETLTGVTEMDRWVIITSI